MQNRTHTCDELRLSDAGKRVQLSGWMDSVRIVSANLAFVILRDFYGTTQVVIDDEEQMKIIRSLNKESVISVTGIVCERDNKNPKIPTGDIEVEPEKIDVLGRCRYNELPFQINRSREADESIRLKYRYLDLRNPDVKKNIVMRCNVVTALRQAMNEHGFLEITTPILTASSPEGARDYLVPARKHPGMFYALPQAPQQFKQLLMTSGFDRYFQIAPCFRDEDARGDRSPGEFYQLDMEMAFATQEDVFSVLEDVLPPIFAKYGTYNTASSAPFKRIAYNDAMERYGSDKPDTRYGMELIDITDEVSSSEFVVFKSATAEGGTVRAINAKNAVSALSRKEIDKLTDYVKGIGAKGLAWIRMTDDGVSSSFAKFMTEDEMNAILKKTGAEKGDVILIVADKIKNHVLTVLGALRQKVAKKLDIIPEGKYNFLWITEFPFFEYDEELKQFVAMHHPFTAPMDECLDYLETDKAKVRAKCYDLVLNGIELSSGSIRITDPKLQSRIFDLLGLSKEEAYSKFGYLLDAFRYGAPPHGGMGIGLDRLCMQMIGCDSLRDVIAYPKLQNASEPMTECPAPVDDEQLNELGIGVTHTEGE